MPDLSAGCALSAVHEHKSDTIYTESLKSVLQVYSSPASASGALFLWLRQPLRIDSRWHHREILALSFLGGALLELGSLNAAKKHLQNYV